MPEPQVCWGREGGWAGLAGLAGEGLKDKGGLEAPGAEWTFRIFQSWQDTE